MSEYFGMGIIELMTQIRLEESRRIMLNQDARRKLKLYSIRDIAIKYGLNIKGDMHGAITLHSENFQVKPSKKSRRYRLPI